MNNLITEVRKLIDDESQPYDYDDITITRYLNRGRGYIEDKALLAIDDDELIYELGYVNIAGLILRDNLDNVIPASDYTLDYINGVVTFTTEPVDINATFTYHDLYNTVADLWLARAATAKFSGNVKLGDEQLPRDKSEREFCVQQYWFFRRNKNMNTTRL